MAKVTISGYELALAAYAGLVKNKEIPNLPEGKVWDWKFSLPNPNDLKSIELSFTPKNKEVEPKEEKKPYQAGDWKDPEVDKIIKGEN